ncbi:MAG: Gfo/Idh/MocA family oxidoreductase [bacterium]|nr:Gfo/Idh/MocA family oxidoreductase [bacterium]
MSIRFGLIGVGSMGNVHLSNLKHVPALQLTAVCDIVPERADAAAATYNCQAFYDHRDLLRAKVCDAVLIATPHYDHTTIGIAALKAGLHVLVEKPISVHKADCERLIAAHTNKKQVFAAMFNQRTDPHYYKLRELVKAGELGALQRVVWIITNWFRTEAYYASGDWRATWSGEGGGVLLNQCPHNLDLLQWICGMPRRVYGFCKFGKYHKIEVEDDVTAYFEYDNGATGVFISTTGEAPGTNRLEITGERGKVVVEHGTVTFTRTVVNTRTFCRTSPERFATPDVWHITIPTDGYGGQHTEILRNFAEAIEKGTPLIAPAREGIHSVELANAMLYSTFTKQPVELPLDAAAYERLLKKLIASSKRKKPARPATAAPLTDMSKSFASR